MNRGNFSIDPDEEVKRNCCGLRGRGFDDFSRDDLRDIILHKNKVIADLEEHAYGSASWIENLNKGLKVAKQIKDKVDKKPPKESEADFRKRLEDFDKERDAPTEEWGADELNGDGFFDDITAAMGDYQKQKKDAYDKLPEAEKLKLETERKKSIAEKRAEVIKEAEQKAIKYLDEDKDKPYYEKSLKLKLGNLTREQYIQNFKDKRAKSFDEAKGGGVVMSKEPPREPPREPRREPELPVQGQLAQRPQEEQGVPVIGEAVPTQAQRDIIQSALEMANRYTLNLTGWQDHMPADSLNRFFTLFRTYVQQYMPAELAIAVNENAELIKELAKLRPDYRVSFIESILGDIGMSLSRAIRRAQKTPDAVYKQIKRSYGGAAAPKAEPKAPSGVAVAAEALKPVREAIQKGIGDAIYGKSDDPRKQKKGLLGISEEDKEESQKKVMKNIVVPIVKTASALKTNTEDIANMIFNPDKYDDDMTERRIKRIKAEEAKAGIVRDKTNPMIIIRKPRGFWTAETSDPKEEAYNQKRAAWRGADNVFYIRVPNPIFAAKLRPSFKEFSDAGVKLWTGVQQNDPKRSEDVDGTLQSLHDDEFIFIPEDRAKEIYGSLRQFVANKQDEGVMEGYEDEGWTKGQLKEFAKIDPRTLKGQELFDWKQSKLALDKATTRNALEKVNKDIAEEEKKATPDKARLAKMREAKVRVDKRLKDLDLRGQKEFNEGVAEINAERDKLQGDYYAKQRADAQANRDQDAADKAEFDAKPIAERIRILEAQGFEEQVEQLRAEEESEKAKEQAQGSVDLLQQAQVVGGGLMDCFRGRRRNRVLPVEPLPIEPPYITTPQPEPLNPYGRPTYTAPPPPPPSGEPAPASPALPNVPQVSGQVTPATRLPPPQPAVGVPGRQPLSCNQQHISIINDALVIALKIIDDNNYTQNILDLVGGTPLGDLFRERGEVSHTFLEGLADVLDEDDDDDPIPEVISYIGRNASELCRELIRFCQRRGIDPMGALTDIRNRTRFLTAIRSRSGRGVGSAKPCWKGYEMIGMKQKGKRTVPNCVPIGGEGGEVDDDDDDDESVEDIDIIRVDMGKGLVYLVDAPPKDKKGKRVGLPFSSFKAALSGPLGIGNRRVFDAETEEEVGLLRDPIYKKLAMKVYKMEEEWRAENLKKLGVSMDEDDDDDVEKRGGRYKRRRQTTFDAYFERSQRNPPPPDPTPTPTPSPPRRGPGELPYPGTPPPPVDEPFMCSECRRIIQPGTRDYENRHDRFIEIVCGACHEEPDVEGDGMKGSGAKPVKMKQSDYYKEHQNIVKLLKNTGKSLLSEAKDQQEEATAMAKKMDAPDPFDDAEMVGAGAIEYTLTKAGKPLFNPSGDMSKAGRQSFTPDYDAYGETVEEGRKNAFNLARSMYDQTKAIELPDFTLLRDDVSLRFYKKHDENVILVGIRGTDVKSWKDLYTWAVIGANQDLRMTTRFQNDLAKLVSFQRNYPPQQFYYVATGSSLAGSIADRFLEMGLIEEAITYNPSIERKYVLEEGVLNHRVYLDTDPLFMLMGQYAPNTEIRVNPNKTNFYNPSKEKDYLIASHSIYPIYNPAFEGGGMEGSGKTYTIEEWKAIFDAKLEEKRKAIEAREAKKKQTAKAKRERAKARRDARKQEPEPEEEEAEIEVREYKVGDEIYLIEEPREGLAFAERRVFNNDNEEIGNLTEDDVGKAMVKAVMRREKIGAFADKSPKVKSSSESLPFFESQQPKAKEKKAKAPASARVELREELVAEQPRSPAGEFAKTKSPKEIIDEMVEDAVKDIYYKEFPDIMKGTVSKEKLYRDKFLTLPKKKQDELRKKVRERVMTQLKSSGRGMKGGARPRILGQRPPIHGELADQAAAWNRPINFGADQAAIDAHAATVPVPDVSKLIADQSLVGTDDTMRAGQVKMRQLKNRLPAQIRSDMYYDDNYDREDWAGFANYHYQQLQLLRYLENMFPDDPARVMNIHERWSAMARQAGGFSGSQFQYNMG